MLVLCNEKEKTVVAEAKNLKIPVVALMGSDTDVSEITYPIPGNDSSRTSIRFFVEEIASAYRIGMANRKVPIVADLTAKSELAK